jgi:molybdopterin-guanine dinucleotide biosynthesis protein B
MSTGKTAPPVISVVGSSGVGKTTLIEKLIPELMRRGVRVGTVKHHKHEFEMDRPGKDSWRHRRAGARVSIISSPAQIGITMDADHDHSPGELLPFLAGVDIVLAEGYKRGDTPKIEVFRPDVHREPLCKNDTRLVALVCDVDVSVGVPRFSPEDIRGLADFLVSSFNLINAVPDKTRKAAV